MIISLEGLNNIILDEKTFIVVCAGGAGNYIACMFRGILFYKLCNLEKTHKLIIISSPSYNGDFVITDIFEDNDNIYFYNCSLSEGQSGINFLQNSFKIDDFKDIKNYEFSCSFEKVMLDIPEIEISKLKDYNGIIYNTNSLYIPPNKLNYCKELLKDLNIHIKSHIKKQINDFLKEHKIGGDGYSIGVHFRGTDAIGSRYNTNFNKNFLELDKILRNDTNIKNIFICSDEECVEDNIKKRYANNYNCISLKKNSKVRKIPSLENYDWFINKESDIKEIKDKKLNNVPGWSIQSHNMYEYIYNTWRDKYQVIDGIIDTIIFNSCSKYHTNTSSSLRTLGYLLIHLECFIYE